MKPIRDIIKEANSNYKEGDYIGEDGLLYCGKCHTRKQTRLEFNGKIIEPFCYCQCEQERAEKEKEQEKKREIMLKIQRYKLSGFQDDNLMNCTFDNDDRKQPMASKVAHNYVDNFNDFRKIGKGLMFYGGVGTGKTFIASCIANALMEQLHPCLVTNFSRIINTVTGMYEGKQQYIDSLNNYDLLVIDDLATERNTEYVNEIVYSVIDSRYRSGKPLIITTNMTLEEMRSETNINRKRIYSRIGEMCIPVLVDGKDRRKAKPDTELIRKLFK